MFLSASSRIPFSMQNISIKNSISILLKIIFCLVCDWKLFFWFCLTLVFQDTLFPHHMDMQDGHRAKAAWLLLFTVYLQQGNFVLLCQHKEIFIWSQEQCMEEPSPTSWFTLVCNLRIFSVHWRSVNELVPLVLRLPKYKNQLEKSIKCNSFLIIFNQN